MRVMLCTPSLFRQPTTEYLMSLLRTNQLLGQHGIAVDTCFVGGDAFVGKARNCMVMSFIKSWETEYPADVLVFMDDDQAWDPNVFLRVVLDSHEFIGIGVPKKTDDQTFNNILLDADEKGDCFIENGMLRSTQIGSGFIVLKRSAIEKMVKAYPEMYAPGDGGLHDLHYNFFEAKVIWPEEGWSKEKPGQFWGEDLTFCKKWCALGERIWIDPNAPMEHIGRKSWTGNFMHFLQKHAKVQTTQLPEPAIPETLLEIEKLAA